jgi:hypothetical protein
VPDRDKGPGWYINPETGRRKFEDLKNHAMNGEMKAVNEALAKAGMPEMWSIRVVNGPGGEQWAVTANPDFKPPQIGLGIGKDAQWSLPRDLYGLGTPNDPQGPVKSARTAQFTNWLARSDLNGILEKFPEFKPFADAYMPVAERFLQIRASQSMPSYLVNTRTGKGAATSEEILEQWMRMVALQKGHADFGVPVRSMQDIAPYLQLQGDRGLAPFIDYYAQESKSWLNKNLPTILGGLSLVGLSPVAALGNGLGSVLGSSIAGQAAAGAAASAALGGDALQGALPALLGGVGDKLGAANLGAGGQAASQALLSAAQGGNPLAAALSSFTQSKTGGADQNNQGGISNMGDFNWKDILATAAAGALTGNSAPTGAAAAAALQLLNGNTGILPQNTTGDALGALLQGYAQNKLQGGSGAQGAADALGNLLFDQYLSSGTLDDKLRDMIGIPDGLGGAIQNALPQGTWDVMQDWLRNKISDELNIPRETTGNSASTGASSPGSQAGTAPSATDIYSLFQHFYNRLPAGDAGFKDALDMQHAATQKSLQSQYQDQRQALNADLNRRGLYSSGIALQQQSQLGEQFNNALADASSQRALDIYSAQQAQEQNRQQQAWDMARTAASLGNTGAAYAGIPAQETASAQASLNPLQTLIKTILDRSTQQQSPQQQPASQTRLPAMSQPSSIPQLPASQGAAATNAVPMFTSRTGEQTPGGSTIGAASKQRFTFSSSAGALRSTPALTATGASSAGKARKPFKFSYLG